MFELKCPSGFTFRAREIGGAEIHGIAERIAPNAIGEVIADVLHGCHIETVDPGPYPETIASMGKAKPDFKRASFTDCWVGLLRLRNLSFPRFAGQYHFEFNCVDSTCKKLSEFNAPLDQMVADDRVPPLPAATGEKIQRCELVETKIRGRVVKFDIARIEQNRKVRDHIRAIGMSADSDVSRVVRQVKFVEGLKQQVIKHIWDWAWSLGADAIDELLQQMDEADPPAETKVLVRCSECRLEQRIHLPLGKAFFRPRSETRRAETEKQEPSSDSSTGSRTSSTETASQPETQTAA